MVSRDWEYQFIDLDNSAIFCVLSKCSVAFFLYRLISFFHLELKKKKKLLRLYSWSKLIYSMETVHTCYSQRKITCKCTLSLVVPWDTCSLMGNLPIHDELEILLKFEASFGNIHVFMCCSCYHIVSASFLSTCSSPLANVPNVYNVVNHIMTFVPMQTFVGNPNIHVQAVLIHALVSK